MNRTSRRHFSCNLQDRIQQIRHALRLSPGGGYRGPLERISHGFESAAFLDRDNRIILIGSVPETATSYARVARLSALLAGALPFPIPGPVEFVEPSCGLPGGALVYPRLPGRHPDKRLLDDSQRLALADDLAAFLRALHSFTLEPPQTLELPRRERVSIEATLNWLWPALERSLSHQELSWLCNWRQELERDDAFWNAPHVLCHGDFWHENLLVDAHSGRLTGVIDLADVHIGDPASDLAPLRHLDRSFADEVFRRYDASGVEFGPNLEARIERYWELREFDGLAFALRHDDDVEWEDGLRKLRSGPILGALNE